MAHIKFNCGFSAFVNFYFGVSSVDEITPDFLKDCGFFDKCEKVANKVKANYNNVASVEITPTKFNDFAVITFDNGDSFGWECSEIDTFIDSNATGKEYTETYHGRKIFKCNAFGVTLYCAAIWPKYPDCFAYCATLDDMHKQIDFVNK